MSGAEEPVRFPEEEEGLPGIHIDIKHDLGTGGDPQFSGGFHGAGSGGSEPVDPHHTGLAKADSMGLDKAAGVRRGPGTAGAHPAMKGGGGSGVGAGGGVGGTSELPPEKQAQPEAQPAGVTQGAKEAVGSALQGAKEAVGLE